MLTWAPSGGLFCSSFYKVTCLSLPKPSHLPNSIPDSQPCPCPLYAIQKTKVTKTAVARACFQVTTSRIVLMIEAQGLETHLISCCSLVNQYPSLFCYLSTYPTACHLWELSPLPHPFMTLTSSKTLTETGLFFLYLVKTLMLSL